MRRICVVITARPSYARIRTVLAAIEEHQDLQLQLVVAGSALLARYGAVIDEIDRDFHVDVKLQTTYEGDTHGAMVHSASSLAGQLVAVFELLRPHVVVTVADRHETLGTAMAASYMNIPLAHIQGGEQTGSIDDKVRHAVTQLSDLHFPATRNAAAHIEEMTGSRSKIYCTGCPSIDIARKVVELRGLATPVVNGGAGPYINPSKPYYVVLHHPVTTHAETARKEMEAILETLEEVDTPAFIFWPNVDAGADAISKLLREYRERTECQWHFFRHLPAEDFLHLLLHSEALIGNSSVGIRECSYLGVKTVNIGDRQQNREAAMNVIHAAPDPSKILSALVTQAQRPRPTSSNLYGHGDAGQQIAITLASVPL